MNKESILTKHPAIGAQLKEIKKIVFGNVAPQQGNFSSCKRARQISDMNVLTKTNK